MMGNSKLFVIATTLGNLKDVTLRALECFRDLKFFFVEDTREFLLFLKLHDISAQNKKVFSYAAHNMKEASRRAIEILEQGEPVGLLCDRGTPCLSDPGFLLINQAHERAIPVIPIPGCSAITAALSVSGFRSDRFLFLGFLPSSAQDRESALKWMEIAEFPICFLESPHRVRNTLTQLRARFADRMLFMAREMTKAFEQYTFGRLSDMESQCEEVGEYTLVLSPSTGVEHRSEDWKSEVTLRLATDKEWAKELGKKFGVPSREVYNALQQEKKRSQPD